jgi:hypothetical protein
MTSHIITETTNCAMFSKRLCLVLPAVLLTLFSSFRSGAQDMNKQSTSKIDADEQCTGNLRIIYKQLKLYLHHSAGALGFPSKLDELYLMSKDPSEFICPADKQINASVKTNTFRTSYEIVNNALKPELSTTSADRIAIIAEKRPNHNGQRFVLFYDGSVRAFDQAQFDRLKNASFIDMGAIDANH